MQQHENTLLKNQKKTRAKDIKYPISYNKYSKIAECVQCVFPGKILKNEKMNNITKKDLFFPLSGNKCTRQHDRQTHNVGKYSTLLILLIY